MKFSVFLINWLTPVKVDIVQITQTKFAHKMLLIVAKILHALNVPNLITAKSVSIVLLKGFH